jgi:hypothetical protein
MPRTARRRRRRRSSSSAPVSSGRRYSAIPRRTSKRRRSKSGGGSALGFLGGSGGGIGSMLSAKTLIPLAAGTAGFVLAPQIMARIPVLNRQTGWMQIAAQAVVGVAIGSFGRRVLPASIAGSVAAGVLLGAGVGAYSLIRSRGQSAAGPVAGFDEDYGPEMLPDYSAYNGQPVSGFASARIAERQYV